MPYTPTNWVDGSTPAINAANLNKIEQAIAALDVKTPKITVSTTAPSSPAVGDIWIDSN